MKDLISGYGRLEILHGLNVQVPKGKVVALLGGNGVGKTTAMKTITGLIRAHGGCIEFDNQRIDRYPSHRIHSLGIALVPQGRELFARMGVEENLDLGAGSRVSGASKRGRLAQIYEHFPRLRDRRTQAAGTLSGGEQQMVAIGRALMSEPRLLLLDEPTVGLAPLVVEEIADIIRRLNDAGETILLVEQNIRMALKVADYVYVVRNGRVVTDGNAAKFSDDEALFSSYIG